MPPMAWDRSRLTNHAAAAAVLGALFVMALGVLAFFLALRPSHLHLEAGQMATYRLHTEMVEIGEDGHEAIPTISDQEVSLICVSNDNDVVMLAPVSIDGEVRDEVTLMNFTSNGSARCLDAAARPMDAGKAIGFFDFNLLPLPPGSEQTWNVELVYAVLPANKRYMQGKVRRTRSGSNPEFQLKLPTSVEWVNEASRYMQIRDLTCTYRFNSSKGVVEAVAMKLIAGVEKDDGRHRFRVKTDVVLDYLGHIDDDLHQVRDLVLASREAQDALADGRRERLTAILTRLQSADVRQPRLRELSARLINEIHEYGQPNHKQKKLQAKPGQKTPSGQWAINIASCPVDQRGDAEVFAATLSKSGFNAFVSELDQAVTVLVGPYADRNPQVMAALAQRYPRQRAVWVRLP